MSLDKASFFDELDSLHKSSDGEADTNELKSLRLSKQTILVESSFLSSPEVVDPIIEKRLTNITKKLPSIHWTTSAPTQTSATETKVLQMKTSLLRYDISNEATLETSFTCEIPLTGRTPANQALLERRTVSTPTIGSVSMTNSLGIANMLKKNPRRESAKGARGTKRKAASLEMKPENERIFQDKVFYYIPDDDVAPLRKMRITRAKSYGVTWIKEWTASITHVIVDSDLTFEQIMKWLKEQRSVLEMPSSVILVNDTYPLDCIKWGRMLNPHQLSYKVAGSGSFSHRPLQSESVPKSEESLKLKKKRSKRRDGVHPTPSPAEKSAPLLPSSHVVLDESSYYTSGLVQSPRETTPVSEEQSFGDALDEIINTVKRIPYLDADDDDQASPGEYTEDVEDSGSEFERAAKVISRKKKRNTGKVPFNQSNFSCMKGGTGKTLEANPNKRTIELLQGMADYYDRIKDNWRTYSYRKAIGTLKRQTDRISTYEEAIALDTIGERLAKKIEEIVQTDRLQRLEHALLDPNDKILQLFMKVYGAGISQAEKWIKSGYETLEDLIKHDALTPNQRIGVEHYSEFNARIPRDEVTALGKVVQEMASSIDSSVQVIIGGSYRRGAQTSGDIDCLITRPETTSSSDLLRFLHTLVTNLTASSFLVAALAVPGSGTDSGSKWHGACVLPSSPSPQIWRRIDFLLVPATEFGAALIYFTGNDIFNRSMRLLASKKQMRLNQRGLYRDVMRGPGRVKLSEGKLVEGEDEKKIFEILGVPWRRPEDRIP